MAEKVCAMADAVERRLEKRREKDVFDLASLLRDGAAMDLARVAQILRRRVELDGFEPRPAHFGPAGRAYIGQNYAATMEPLTGPDFIPFEPAWDEVVGFVHRVLDGNSPQR